MREDGHDLTFKMISSPPTVNYYDDYSYDNIVLMAPSAKGILIKLTQQT